MKKWIYASMIIILGIIIRWQVIEKSYIPHANSIDTLKKINLTWLKEDSLVRSATNKWVDYSSFRKSLLQNSDGVCLTELHEVLETSNHPPLYYDIYHITNYSFFGGTESLFLGHLLNLVFWSVSALLLFILSFKLFKNQGTALVILSLYAASFGTITTVILLKGYVLQECLFVAIVLLLLSSDKYNWKHYLFFTIICLALFLTHYFSYPYVAILGLFIAIWLVRKRNYKAILFHGLATLVAAGMALLVYPKTIRDILYDRRANEIQEHSGGNVLNEISEATSKLFEFFITIEVLLVLAAGLLFIAIQLFRRVKIQWSIPALFVGGFGLVTFYLVDIVSFKPFIRYLIPAVPLIFILVGCSVQPLLQRLGKFSLVIPLVILLLAFRQIAFADESPKPFEQVEELRGGSLILDQIPSNASLCVIPPVKGDPRRSFGQVLYVLDAKNLIFMKNLNEDKLKNKKNVHLMIRKAKGQEVKAAERLGYEIIGKDFSYVFMGKKGE